MRVRRRSSLEQNTQRAAAWVRKLIDKLAREVQKSVDNGLEKVPFDGRAVSMDRTSIPISAGAVRHTARISRLVTPGYNPPPNPPEIAMAAADARAAAVSAQPQSHEIPVRPRRVWDQGTFPACISCALSGAMEMMSTGSPALSPMFHYYVTAHDMSAVEPSGMLYVDEALSVLEGHGISRHDLHSSPITEAGAAVRPSANAYVDGASRALGKIGARQRWEEAYGVSRAVWMRENLLLNRPVIVLLRLPEEYPDGFLSGNFEWRDPRPTSASRGHCVLATGFSDLRQAVHIRDSYGDRRFERGNWWLGYRVIDSKCMQTAYALIP